MKIMGECNDTSTKLNLKMSNREYGLSLRRVDEQSEIRFSNYHDKELSVEDVRQFIPHAATIQFNETPLHSLGIELQAVSNAYSVHLFFPKDSRFFTPNGVVADFRDIFGTIP